MTDAGKRLLARLHGSEAGERRSRYDSYFETLGDILLIEAEAVVAHEAILRERGWMDEYEVETAAAMNYGDGQAAERAYWTAATVLRIIEEGTP